MLLAGRYRLVALVGRGGMSEVYRAEDLKLGQTVALKFLPERLADHPKALELLLSEVRLTRQISHPDVCRVYDVGEVEGLHFLSMEYIDGEDLASLLRRIGRLPADKALEIGRHLCAGLAAAHDRGILHRDLKPANVMIDGRGNLRITDFGLAAVLGQAVGEEDRKVGTPAYMAPEQAARGEVTVKSDIYSLGLILHEMFTGQPARGGKSSPTGAARGKGEAASPRSVAPDVDQGIARVIQRCLETDPALRPASALAVAAALPGGDPLAAALAAGETPSPDIVAAAGEVGTLSLAAGWVCVLLVFAGIAAVALLTSRSALVRRIPFDKPPAVLADRAREVLKTIGYPDEPADTAIGFRSDRDYLRYLKQSDPSPGRWDPLASGSPAPVFFWYRQSPRHMVAVDMRGRVTLSDPPPFTPGMANVLLDPGGRLIELHVVPPYVLEAGQEVSEPDWNLLFAQAGLDPAQFAAADPERVAPMASDRALAWVGTFPGQQQQIRVEAAAHRGRPVWFKIIGPWSTNPTLESFQPGEPMGWGRVVLMISHVAILFGCILLVRRNLISGRGDTRGALRASLFFGAALTLVWIFQASHVPSVGDEWRLMMSGVGMALFVAAFFWVLYVAVEPYVRSRWPGTIIAWSRVLSGRFRDPLVGRDVLIGGAFGVASAALMQAQILAPALLGLPTGTPQLGWPEPFLGGADLVGSFFEIQSKAFFAPVAWLFLILMLWIVLRKQWLAVAVFFLFYAGMNVLSGDHLVLDLLFGSLGGALLLFVLLKFGLVALMAMFLFQYMLTVYTITTDLSAWYAGSTLFAVGICAAVTLAAFLTALGGRPAFKPVS